MYSYICMLLMMNAVNYINTSCSFTPHGLNTIGDCGDYNFDQLEGSFEHCTDSCMVNPLCHGVSYATSRYICRRYTCNISTTAKATGKVEFSSLTCTVSRQFPLRAYRCFAPARRNKTGDCSSYRTVQEKLQGCKEECIEDDICRAASFNADTDECNLHNCDISNDTSLETQLHLLKTCGYSICHYNYAGVGYGSCSSRTHYAKDLNACLKFCEELFYSQEFNCTAVSYLPPTIIDFHNCALSDCEMYTYDPLILPSDVYIRHCPEERYETCPWTEDTNGIRGECLLYDKVYGTLSQCQASCDEEIWCLGVSFTSRSNSLEIGPCLRYPCNNSTGGRRGNMAFFSRKCSDTITSASLLQRDESTSKPTSTTVSNDEVTMFAQGRTSFLPTSTKNKIGSQSFVGTEVTELSTSNTGNAISYSTVSSVSTSNDEISSTLGRTTAQVEMSTLSIEDTSYRNGVTYNAVTYNNSRVTSNMCLCWCSIYENETFAEFYERIIEPLKVNKKSLSSTIRKLTCANDNRPSAAHVGYVGVVTLLIVILTLVALDFSSLANKLITHLRQN